MLLFSSLPFGSICTYVVVCFVLFCFVFLLFFSGGGEGGVYNYSFLDWPCLSVAILMSLRCGLILS